MASIDNLGTAWSGKLMRKSSGDIKVPAARRSSGRKLSATERAALIRRTEQAMSSRDFSSERSRARDKQTEQIKRMSLDELADMLRKVNLRINVFEIQAKFIVNQQNGFIYYCIVVLVYSLSAPVLSGPYGPVELGWIARSAPTGNLPLAAHPDSAIHESGRRHVRKLSGKSHTQAGSPAGRL